MADAQGPVKSIVQHHGPCDIRAMRVILSVTSLLALTACGPLDIYYKPGISVAKMEKDELDCEVKALRDAPVANQTRQEPPTFVPPRQICDAAGNCVTRPGYWEPGRIYTVDVNDDLRFRVRNSCMADKGYRPVSIPTCSRAVANATPPQATSRLPRLTENSCVIRNDDGSWQIVNQG